MIQVELSSGWAGETKEGEAGGGTDDENMGDTVDEYVYIHQHYDVSLRLTFPSFDQTDRLYSIRLLVVPTEVPPAPNTLAHSS